MDSNQYNIFITLLMPLVDEIQSTNRYLFDRDFIDKYFESKNTFPPIKFEHYNRFFHDWSFILSLYESMRVKNFNSSILSIFRRQYNHFKVFPDIDEKEAVLVKENAVVSSKDLDNFQGVSNETNHTVINYFTKVLWLINNIV